MLNKKRETRQLTGRGSSKVRKIEGNVNFTSNRVTAPPRYLSLGISSETFRRDTGKHTDCKPNEDLHGLFNKCLNVNSINVRRSERISNRNSFPIIPDFPGKWFSDCKNVEIERTPSKKIWKNRSKSLFREINEKYVAKTAYLNNLNILTPPLENTIFDSSSKEESSDHILKFCTSLSNQLRKNPGKGSLAACQSRILSKIDNINCVLSGKTESRQKMSTNVKFPSNLFRNDPETNFQYYPRSQWVYETPPRQKLALPKLEECQMLPAVIYSTNKDTNIYEIAPNMKIDLSKFASGQKLNFDKRFLSHVDTVTHNKDVELEKNFHKKTHRSNQADDLEFACFPVDQPVSPEKLFNFTKPNPFIGLISRPRKTEKRSRLKNILKRKLDTPNCYDDSFELLASGSQGQDMFGNRFPSETDELQLTNFQLKKKLFCDRENDRVSNLDQANLFDFSQ